MNGKPTCTQVRFLAALSGQVVPTAEVIVIYFLGDLHGDFAKLDVLRQQVEPDDVIIQVGDFGFYPHTLANLSLEGFPCKVFAIDGNHEDYPFLAELVNRDEVSEFRPNMFYVPRGTVMEIEGQLIGFLGGACSVDISRRKPYGRWYEEETITEDELQRLVDAVGDRQLDVLVAHAAPPELIRRNFAPLSHEYWGLPVDWVDHSSNRVAEAISTLNPKKFVCGHMHRSVVDGDMRILDINEIISIDQL